MSLSKRALAVIAGSALTIGAAATATTPAQADYIGLNTGKITSIDFGGVNVNVGDSSGGGGRGSRPEMAGVPDLTEGMAAPKIDVGSKEVEKGTVSYSNSIGASDSFSVGAVTNMGASVSASSTPDYKVKSSATFGIGGKNGSTINQVIGSTVGEANSPVVPSGSITGSFDRAYTPDTLSNEVAVSGIGTDASINTKGSKFKTGIQKGRTTYKGGKLINSGAGSANGSASGSVGTTTTASANSSQFVSSFAQAY